MRAATPVGLLLMVGAACGARAHAQDVAATTPRSTTVAAPDGVPLPVREWGNPEGPVLLLLDDLSESSVAWRQRQDAALAARYRMLSLQLRDRGASGESPVARTCADSRCWADDVAAVIRAKGLARPVLVGWSLGGSVATHYVRHNGDGRIAGIVFVGSTVGSTGGRVGRLTVPTLFVTGAEARPVSGSPSGSLAPPPRRFDRELMLFVDSAQTVPAPVSAREAAALRLVRSYLDAHNRHDAEASLAHYAADAQFVLSNGRGVARGHEEIGALERLDAALGS
jgi:pimeloyl-ACP methyl ester carboxylesterase